MTCFKTKRLMKLLKKISENSQRRLKNCNQNGKDATTVILNINNCKSNVNKFVVSPEESLTNRPFNRFDE